MGAASGEQTGHAQSRAGLLAYARNKNCSTAVFTSSARYTPRPGTMDDEAGTALADAPAGATGDRVAVRHTHDHGWARRPH